MKENRQLKKELEKSQTQVDRHVSTESSVYETLEAAKSLMMFMTVCNKEDFCIVESEEVAKDYCKKHSPHFSYRVEEIED